MAHEITTYHGRFSAWHHQGIVHDRFLSVEDLMNQSDLNWQVDKVELIHNGKPCGIYATRRIDTDEIIASVGKDYEVMQHTAGFTLANSLVGSGVDCFETAGVLRGLTQVWALAKLDTSISVGGEDKTDTYLLMSTSHDGSLAFEMRLTGVRVVCANTLALALGRTAKAGFKVYHSKQATTNFQNASQAMMATREDIKTAEARLNFLADRMMTADAMKAVMEELLQTGKDRKKRGETMLENRINRIMDLYESNDDNAFPSQRGTAYNLLNAITGYVDHVEAQTRGYAYATAGNGDRLKTQALEVITLAADNLPARTRPVYSFAANGTVSQSENESVVADLLGI